LEAIVASATGILVTVSVRVGHVDKTFEAEELINFDFRSRKA